LSASVQNTHIVLRRRMLHTRDAYDRFLPSTASISSTRVSFALDEIASRACGLFRIPHTPPVLEELPPVGRTIEHPAVSRRRGGSGGSRIDPVTHLSGRSTAPACRSLCSGPRLRSAPRSLRSETREDPTGRDPARLPSKSAFLRLASCDTRRAQLGTRPMSRELARLRWFCRHQALHYASSPRRCRAALCKHGCFG
jgi:hypothetical protein